MANLQTNSKSFSLKNVASKSFSLAVSGFQFATSLFFRVRNTINIDTIMTALASAQLSLNAGKIRLANQVKLTGKQTQTISLRRISLLATLTVEGSDVLSIFLRKPLLFISSTREKIITIISQKLPIDFDPTLAEFFTLGDYDPDTLGTWDATTLGTMDYTT